MYEPVEKTAVSAVIKRGAQLGASHQFQMHTISLQQMALYSLGSHFIKHLSRTTTFSFPVRRLHRHIPPRRTSIPAPFPALSPPFTKLLTTQWGCLNSIRSTKFSTTASPESSFTAPVFSESSFAAPYLSADIICRKDVAVDMFSEALLCFGASSTSMDEDDDEDIDAEVSISCIFDDCKDVDKCISLAANSIGLNERPRYKVIKGDPLDWINNTKESFNPVEVAEGLWVVPEGRTPPDLQATNIILNPGFAFGTGEHPTTKLCLLLLCSLVKGGELFLDYGTGSGILAIAAIKFGAAFSVGLDVDPQAIRSAQQNASLNNLGADKLRLHLVPSKRCPTTFGNGETETQKYDVVIANILYYPLLELADHIVSYAKPGAAVGVSGIISEQVQYIVLQYSKLLDGISVTKMDDWALVSGTRKRNSVAS
ncbi:hypothetical protein RHMOL_Rhmol06G0273000 [Rhododendron molle]|uniref:Uncharacterized protein n=1 Tax=Rhododendron molle TaxID=49168 RepID=A0ACC0NGP9_RHOML|nr:hypothetical protein RHMOL_Rhmol06G0273000 [Rhododendron molle]